MKRKIIFISISLLILFTYSCEKFLDVNHNPNVTEESKVELVFPAGTVSACYVIGGQYFMLGSVWSQYWTSQPNAPQYQTVDNYNITTGDYDGRAWSELYSGALMDLEWVRNTSKEQENWTYYLMATTVQCYVYQVLADLYDQIPFSEALQKIAPKFDSGQEVYDGLIARLDTALSYDLEAETCQQPLDDDIFFEGDMQAWVKFANTLKLKIYMRQAYVNEATAKAGVEKMIAEGAEFLDQDVVMDQFTDEMYHDNPIYGTEWRLYANRNICASKTLHDYLTAKVDPRLSFIYVDATLDAMFQGDYRNEVSDIAQNEKLARPNITGTTPVFLMSKAESFFLQAEAALRGWTTGDVQALYTAAVTADADYFDVDETVILNYATFNPAATFDEKLELIMVQKWIALANKLPLEAFFEHNRTGYPRELGIKVSDSRWNDDEYRSSGYFVISETSSIAPPVLYPKRLLFPSSESTNNKLNCPDVVPVNTKVWWDKNTMSYVIN